MVEPETLRTRAIVVIGSATIAIIALACAISWLLVEPSPITRAIAPSKIEHALFVARPLPPSRLPIARAIDAVVADPSLIGGHP